MAEATSLPGDLVALMANASWSGARLAEQPLLSLASVRARGPALARLKRALGVDSLPAPNEHRATALGDCLWLRPDEWLVATASRGSTALFAALDTAMGEDDGAVIDVSASRVILDLAGRATRDVLASCCPLDLHPRAFAPGWCAQSLIAKVPVLLQLVDGTPRWRLYVSPSLADYVVRWLVDGMEGARAEAAR
ncbi:MAG: sarcosine oxidase subunit gamma [Gemmatimonadaceae bacterium]